MYTVVIHDSETEEIVGSVTQADGCSDAIIWLGFNPDEVEIIKTNIA
jgi:hypothetical protein